MTRSGPLPGPLPGVLGGLASRVYAWEVARRNRAYDNRRGVVEIDRPVLSVGNLSVGGTGKSPMVKTIVRMLLDVGHSPAIAMRGYASSGDPHGGDEAREYRAAMPNVPVVAQPNRLQGLLDLFATPAGEKVDCVVLDDGFQHRRLARALDVVLMDCTRSPFEDALLPAGWLREPVSALARAHVAVATHCASANAGAVLLDRARAINPAITLCACDHVWTHVQAVAGAGTPDTLHVASLAGKHIAACCAIGNPAQFLAQCEAVTQRPLACSLVLPDHDPFSPTAVARLLALLREHTPWALIVTGKDWTKLARARAHWPCPVLVPTLDLRFSMGEAELRRIVQLAANTQDDDTITPDA